MTLAWVRDSLGNPGRLAILSGLAWGIIVTTSETLAQPPLELSLAEYVMLYSRIILHYGAGGLVMAWLAARIGARQGFPKWIAAIAILVSAALVAVVIDRLSVWYVPLWREDEMAIAAPPLDVAAHLAWIFAVYGGLYLMTFFFLQNESRTRDRLRMSELARLSAEARMERALSEETSAAIAPDLLLRALSELGRRYDHDHPRADRLLDKLVQLLRSVSGATGRIDLAHGMERLRRELELPREIVSTGGRS